MRLPSYFDSRRAIRAGGWLATILALLFAQTACMQARADSPAASCVQPRPEDQVWAVSCRSLGCEPLEQQVTQLKYWRYDRQRSWVRSSLSELVATDDPNVITTLFAHGNRISHEEAFSTGWTAYRALAQSADEHPIRFIIWSWPSESYRGLVEDARMKAWRTGPAGYHLGWFVDQLNPQAPVSFLGHSFGARVVTGALHLLGGGSLDGHRLGKRVHPDRQLVQVVLLVAALDNDWLLPGHYHGRAMSQVAGMFLVNNNSDMLLKHYHILYGRRGPEEALGYTGLATWCVSNADLSKVSQIDGGCQVGRRHQIVGYLESPDLVARMRPYLVCAPSVGPPKLQAQIATSRRGEPTLPAE